jgi:transglutaminase-like putative cysteine protease
MKIRILMILLLCGALTAFAQNFNAQSQRQAAESATLERYPDADTVLVEDGLRLSYKADGSYRYTSETAVKILTEKGRQSQSTVTIGYDAAYGTTRFQTAEIIKPNGTVQPIDLETQSRETIDSSQMDSNIYDPNSKRILLSIPNLEIGDMLHYTVAGERTKAVVPNTWSDLFMFEDTAPVLHSICTIDAPADAPLSRIELKDPVGNTVNYLKGTRPDGGICHIWEAFNVPQMFPEPDMPQAYTVSQRILLSTIPDWETLSKWYWELSQPRLDAVNDAMKEKVKELTAGLTDRQEKIKAIFRFVSQDIRYMGITVENEAPGYEPHDVSLTFDNRYGVCRDKAALLVAMLRLAGLDAYPVLIYVGPKKDPEVPQPWFNHAITAVRNDDGSWQLMDSTNENTRDLLPAYLCNCSYLVAHPDGDPLRTSPVIPPEDNMLTIHMDGSLDDNNLMTATALLSFGGINDTAYRGRLATLKPEEREPYFESRLKDALGAARLTRLEIVPADVRDTSVPLSVTLGFEVENAVVQGTEKSMLHVPTLINRFGLFGAVLGGGTGLDKREYPLQTQVTCGVSETVRLDLTAGRLRPEAIPSYETIDTPRVHISRSVSETNGIITAAANLLLRTVEFSPAEYLELKDNLKTAERNARKRIILEQDGFPREADFATLDDQTRYILFDANNFTQIKTVQQKVLTYAGKQALSDIKVAYNTGFQDVALNYARVTAPDGTVRDIDKNQEVNIMDAPWVSSAPRYPAEKIMVVNLPSVEIGSVIDYQISILNHNVPFFSTTETFAELNPLVKKTVQVEIPHRLDLQVENLAQNIIHHRIRTTDNGNVIHEWSAENRPMIRKEDHLPPTWNLAPALFLSTGDMESYAKTVREHLYDAAKPTSALKAKAKELTQGIKDRLQKMAALRDFVDRTVRIGGPGLTSLPLSAITPAEQTLTEGYGNRTDYAVLLYALADAAKLKPRFVLSSALPEMKELSTPALATFQRNPFNTPLVAIEYNDTETYFGDSGRYATPGTLAHTRNPAIDLKESELEIPDTAIPNRGDRVYRFTVQETGDVSVSQTTQFSGTAFEAFHKRFAEFTPEDLRREEQTLLSALSQSAQTIQPINPSFRDRTLTLEATLPNYAVIDGNYMYLTLPGGLGNILDIQSDQRISPFYIAEPIGTSYTYELELPKGWRTVLLPESFRTELPANGGTVSVQTEQDGNTLTIIQKADIHPALVPVKDYDELLELNSRLTQPSTRTILLERIPEEK